VNCSRCGRENPDGLKFCQDCGNRLNAPSPPRPASGFAAPAAPAAAPTTGTVVVPSPAARPETAARPAAAPFQFGPPTGAEKRCVRCGTGNPAQGRFCANCGSPLPGEAIPEPAPAQVVITTCPRCRGANGPQMTFCQFCGARLAEGAQAPPAVQVLSPNAAVAPATGPGGGTPAAVAAFPFSAGTNFQFGPSHRPDERAKLVVIGQDGKPGREYEIESDQTDVGREEGSILLVNDPYVSPRHARLLFREGRFFIRDLESVNGVYVRLRAPERLQHADLVLVGLEVLRFEVVSDAERGLGPAAERGTQVFGSPAAPRYARLCQRTVEGVTRDVYYPTREETVIGREVGDVVFTTDPFMSRRHAAIARDPATSTFSLKDLGSSNGTYLAIRGERELLPGDHVRIGQHLFRLDFGAGSRSR
jgi:pSer/pThr/pTyr-binding forkhead associated (FHA) protein